jgi:hypothetical protein
MRIIYVATPGKLRIGVPGDYDVGRGQNNNVLGYIPS